MSDSSSRQYTMSDNYKWFVVAMLWCITFFNYADRMALNANMPLIRDTFHLDKATGGMLGSAFGYSYGLCAIFAGFIVDRVHRRKAVLLGLLAWSVICFGTGFANSFWMLFAFLALEGLGEAFYFPAAMSLMSDYHGKKTRSRAMSINQTSVYIGTILGTYFAGKLGAAWGWQSAFWVFGALGGVLAFVLWRYLHEPERGAADRADAELDGNEHVPARVAVNLKQHRTASGVQHVPARVAVKPAPSGSIVNTTLIVGGSLLIAGLFFLLYRITTSLGPDATIIQTVGAFAPGALMSIIGTVFIILRAMRIDHEFWRFFRVFFTTPSAVLLLLAFLCANSVAMILLVWMPSFIVDKFYDNNMALLATAGLLATMPLQLASMIGSPTGGMLADFIRSKTPRGRILVQMTGVLCAVPFVFLCGKTDTKVLLVTALIGWGLFKGIYDSNIFASVYDVIRPDLRGMAAGFMNMFAWAGGAIAPIIAGSIADKHKELGLGGAISGASMVYILAGLLLFTSAMVFVKRDAARMQAQLRENS